jgi:hypothetical protein
MPIIEQLAKSDAVGLEAVEPARIELFIKSKGHHNSAVAILGESTLQRLLAAIPSNFSGDSVRKLVENRDFWLNSDAWFSGLMLFSTLRAINQPPRFSVKQTGQTMSEKAREMARGKPLLTLDTIESFQRLWEYCANMETTTAYIHAAIEDGARGDDAGIMDISTVGSALLDGNLASLEKWADARSSVSFFRIHDKCVVETRNPNWVREIEKHLESHFSVTYVVGALHLVGPSGMLALLRQRGFNVERLPIEFPICLPGYCREK